MLRSRTHQPVSILDGSTVSIASTLYSRRGASRLGCPGRSAAAHGRRPAAGAEPADRHGLLQTVAQRLRECTGAGAAATDGRRRELGCRGHTEPFVRGQQGLRRGPDRACADAAGRGLQLKNEFRGPNILSNEPLSKATQALAMVESGGNYSAVGPVVEKGSFAGQRAYGKYQVMEGNIGPWTQEILGKRYSVEEFLNDPKAQDAVAQYRLQQSYDQYGNWEDAASVWFSGRPMAEAGNDTDGYHTVPEYIDKFKQHMRS